MPEENPLAQPLILTTKGLVAHLEAELGHVLSIILGRESDQALPDTEQSGSCQIVTAADTPRDLKPYSVQAASYRRPRFYPLSGSDSSDNDDE